MFNLAYNTGYIPSEWKLANVVPIHKKDDKNKVVNYRPISLTSLVMKVFERILYDELLARTQEKIDPRQHGFLKNKSCNTADFHRIYCAFAARKNWNGCNLL